MKLLGIHLGNRAAPETQPAATAQFAPGTEISYDPQLIDRFLAHHRQLATQIERLRASALAADFNASATALHAFRVLLYQHLLEENVRLYTYLGVCLRSSEDDYALMQDMRSEMGRVGRVVTRFIKTWSEAGIHAGNVQQFLQELDVVVVALGDRLHREENLLYTLYLPPGEMGVSDG